MKPLKIFAVAAAGLLGATACDETSPIGESIVDDNLEIVVDSAYTLSAEVYNVPSIPSRTVTQLLGRINVPEYGFLESSVLTQFMPSTALDTLLTPENVDSIRLSFVYSPGAYVGDSLAPLGLGIYELNAMLPSPIFSNAVPADYYDAAKAPMANVTYNMGTVNSDSLAVLKARYLHISLGREFGQRLVEAYLADPSAYGNPTDFCRNVFPGFHFGNTFGSGRLGAMRQTSMRIHYHHTFVSETTKKDTTTRHFADYFLVTPEVVSDNCITYRPSASLQAEVGSGNAIVTSPIGYGVKFTLPVTELLSRYRSAKGDFKVINGLSLQIPADSIPNSAGIGPAPDLLLVKASQRDQFFLENKLADNKTSFYATYNTYTRSYHFTALRDYIIEMLGKEQVSDDDITFVLCPLNVEKEAIQNGYNITYVESAMNPYVERPTMTRLHFDKAKIKFTYSLQSKKNY